MKLLKKDETYKYYQISEKESDDACYWESDVIAIAKEDMKYKTAKDCLLDGEVIACEYDSYKDPNYVIDVWVVDVDTIKLVL